MRPDFLAIGIVLGAVAYTTIGAFLHGYFYKPCEEGRIMCNDPVQYAVWPLILASNLGYALNNESVKQ